MWPAAHSRAERAATTSVFTDLLRWMEHSMTKLATLSGVRPFSLHDLRDTGISWLHAAGVDDLVIARLAGHTGSGDVTHSYIHLFEPQLRAAVATFDTLRSSLVP